MRHLAAVSRLTCQSAEEFIQILDAANRARKTRLREKPAKYGPFYAEHRPTSGYFPVSRESYFDGLAGQTAVLQSALKTSISGDKPQSRVEYTGLAAEDCIKSESVANRLFMKGLLDG